MYLLDTNAVSEPVKKHPNPHFMKMLEEHKNDLLSISTVTIVELRFGAMRLHEGQKFWQMMEEKIIHRCMVLPFGEKEAFLTGDLLAKLSDDGEIIEIEDAMIAATALARHYTVVTANEKHFRRIPGLKVENWMRRDN